MKRFAPLLLLAMLAWLFPAPSSGQFQVSSDAAWTQWNYFTQHRTANTYSTIIGMPGTSFVSGSNYADPISPTLPIPLPCSIYYLGVLYPTGYEVRASIAGFFSFDAGVSQGSWPYVLMSNSPFNRLIMPFWSDLRTSGGAGQGIFYRLDVDPVTHDSTMTIEWNVETMSPPLASGRFQARLHQIRPSLNIPSAWRTEIFFHYDLNHRLPRDTSLGAVIGLKNLGQEIGNTGPLLPGADNTKLLLLVDTGVVTPDSAAISRLRTFGTNHVPEWFATMSGTPSGSFHYDFPDSNYCVTPVITDVMPENMPPGAATTTFPLVPIQSTTTLQVIASNVGIEDQFNVPMTIEITYGPTVVFSDTVMVDTLLALTSIPTAVQLPTSTAGTYTLRAITELSGDQNRMNDTMLVTYYVTAQSDGMATGITSPKLTEDPTQPRYVTGETIPIIGEVSNSGMKDDGLIVGYAVLDSRDSIVAGRLDTLKSGEIPPLTTVSRSFGSFTPATPDAYRVAIYCSAMNDEIRDNDLLIGKPSWEWRRHGPSPDEPGMRPIPIMVYDPVDLIVYPSPMCIPAAGDTVTGSTPVLALVGNNGGLLHLDGKAHAVITDATGSTVYNCIRNLVPLQGGQVIMQYFDDFTPDTTGEYCIRVYVEADSLDPDHSNDTTRWCFTVLGNASEPGEGSVEGSGGDTLDGSGAILSQLTSRLPREATSAHGPGRAAVTYEVVDRIDTDTPTEAAGRAVINVPADVDGPIDTNAAEIAAGGSHRRPLRR